MAHTPGPWVLRIDKSEPGETYEDGSLRPDWYWIHDTNEKIVIYKTHLKPEDKDNLILIASAPELLDACMAAKAYIEATAYEFDEDGKPNQIYRQIVDAIAKADVECQQPKS